MERDTNVDIFIPCCFSSSQNKNSMKDHQDSLKEFYTFKVCSSNFIFVLFKLYKFKFGTNFN